MSTPLSGLFDFDLDAEFIVLGFQQIECDLAAV